MTNSIRRAIKNSVIQNRIVTVEGDTFEHREELREELQSICDDSVKGNDRYEFWGTDDDGNEWRVHLDVSRRLGNGAYAGL